MGHNLASYFQSLFFLLLALLFIITILRFKNFKSTSFRMILMSSLLIIASQFTDITTLQNLINIVAIILWYLYSPSRIKYPIFNIISGTIGVAILCVNMIFPESVNILYNNKIIFDIIVNQNNI